MKEVPKKWEPTGREARGERVCPDCYADQARKDKGGGIVKEYVRSVNGVQRYAYRCEQTTSDQDMCGATAETGESPAGGESRVHFDQSVGVAMEKSYHNNARTILSSDFE